ncbi:MAG: HU family DNA-binding protein [Bacteroidales bacterium]|nr:HU family DNA-binding protein [Bacteroidales bacterium]
MNKTELINGIAIEAGISKVQAKAAVEAAVKVMQTALLKGDKISVVGFGTLAVQEKAERAGVNPATGAKITIPAKKVVKFKAGAELAEKLK